MILSVLDQSPISEGSNGAQAVFVEMLNIRLKRVSKPVKLHDDYHT